MKSDKLNKLKQALDDNYFVDQFGTSVFPGDTCIYVKVTDQNVSINMVRLIKMIKDSGRASISYITSTGINASSGVKVKNLFKYNPTSYDWPTLEHHIFKQYNYPDNYTFPEENKVFITVVNGLAVRFGTYGIILWYTPQKAKIAFIDETGKFLIKNFLPNKFMRIYEIETV